MPAPLATHVVLSRDYAAPDGAVRALRERGARVEIIAESPGQDEYMHLDSEGNLVHRISGRRSYLGRAWFGDPYAARTREKLFELTTLWNRAVVERPQAGRPARPSLAPPPSSLEIVCCTYNRIDEPLATLRSVLAQRGDAAVTVVHQNLDFPERLFTRAPELRGAPGLELLFSEPAGLPRARNTALARSSADLVIFIDDDVELDPGFVDAYRAAASVHPGAAAIAGRVRSRVMGAERENRALTLGQVSLTGSVDDNFDSLGSPDLTLVLHSPRGANMAFRRDLLVPEFGSSWFDESLPGSAHREETTFAIELFRRGHLTIHAPQASLLHLEAEQGGCENRGKLSFRQKLDHLTLDYLFLNRLYRGHVALRACAPLLLGAREVRAARGVVRKAGRAWLNLNAYYRGRRLSH